MSLKTPEKLRKLQRALYAKAKEEPQYRLSQYMTEDRKAQRERLLQGWNDAVRRVRAEG